MSNDSTARRVFGVTYETIIRRIVKTFDAATPADLEAGARWYPDARLIAESLTGHSELWTMDLTVDQVAVILAHLSPRTPWSRNVAGAISLVRTGEAPGHIGAHVQRAIASLEFADPHDSFGPMAPKTSAFAANILGDTERVTVDVWALRVAGLREEALSRKGAYDLVQDAYRAAARRRCVEPTTMQATTWIVARGGRAA